MRRLALILVGIGALADAAPTVEIRAQTQLALSRVKRIDDGRVEVVGTLTDKLTGQAIEGQHVLVQIGGESVPVTTEADGTFHAFLPAGDGLADVHLSFTGWGRLEAAQPLQVTTDPAKSQIQLGLVKLGDDADGAQLQVNAQTDDNLPVQVSVDLAIAPLGSDSFRALRTVETNRVYVLSRKEAGGPGVYRVRATFAGDDSRQKATSDINVELTAATTTTIELAKQSYAYEDTIVVIAKVTDDDHRGVPRAALSLMAADKRIAQGATGADGSYRFRVEAQLLGKGEWTLQIQADPGSPTIRPSRSPLVTIRIASPQPVPVSYTIAAFVATALAAGGFFAARGKPWQKLRRPAPPAEVPSAEGAVEQAHGGVVLANPGLMSTLRRAADDGFSGVVRDTVRGRPVAQAVVNLLLEDLEREVRTGPDGSFTLEKLAPGNWHAEVAALGHVTERFYVSIPHRGELRGVRVDLVPVRERVFQLYRRAAEPVLPEPRLWGIWSPRQIVDHVRSKRPSPALAELTDFVEEVYFSPRLVAETVLPQASERVDRAIQERAPRA